MYANMGKVEKFQENVINDTRSFSIETFNKAHRIMTSSKKGVEVPQDQVEKFELLLLKLETLKLEQDQEDAFYDDAPEEFLDPVLQTIMKDPVELPGSKTIIDYLTIKKHLMNEQNDPFNRQPLELD
mmetsp:Transcript_29552/g.28744  ORF Transcript_29552/g.28744 Transcript_29552/m.28744 type:complete len:127 (+) Transcript_29552:919-1299(+)